jgi:hypothetical protein
MKVEYRGHTIEVSVNREEEIWMAVVLIKPSPDNSSYSAWRTTIGVWGCGSEAEAEAAGLRRGKEWLS